MRSVFEYLERSAERLPDKLAFADERESFSFSRLLSCARAAGSALCRLTPRLRAPICVLTDRSAGCIAAFMGALACGNFYVPLDAAMPLSRLRGIMEELRPAALLYPDDCAETARELETLCPVLSFSQAFAAEVDDEALALRRAQVLDIDPTYAIFTSGSTGRPKGIVVSHRSVADFTDWLAETGDFSENDVMGNQAPFYFDLSVKDIYQTLRNGASCHIIPKKLFMFPLPLLEFLAEKQVTVLLWATSAFHLLARFDALGKVPLPRLRTVMLGGEALQAKQLNVWRRAQPHVRYVNLYGPTEVTVDCCWYPIEREFADTEPIPIGRACANKEVFLLDAELKPVGPGQPGEICVRGSGLARGYFGQWDKTAAAFIQDPRNTDWPDMIYRTGDMAVMDGDGVLTYLSRSDGQIKHMGYRIELGEVETALNSLPQVGQAVCFFDGGRDRIVCCFEGGLTPAELTAALGRKLPRYMLPNAWLSYERLPMNANGKVDRAKLKESYFDENNS